MFLAEDDLSSTSLIVLICILSTLLITTWILIAVYAFLKRRRGRLLVKKKTHGAVDICLADQDVSHHYDEVQDIDGCYTFLDRSAQETHYEDVNKL